MLNALQNTCEEKNKFLEILQRTDSPAIVAMVPPSKRKNENGAKRCCNVFFTVL
jgi:hypothetical protein